MMVPNHPWWLVAAAALVAWAAASVIFGMAALERWHAGHVHGRADSPGRRRRE